MIRKEERRKREDGSWELVIKICNREKAACLFWVTSQPWGVGSNEEGSPKIKDIPDSQNVKLEAEECRELIFGPYNEKPGVSYTDVYKKVKKNGEWEIIWVNGTKYYFREEEIGPKENGKTKVGIKSVMPYPWKAFFAYNKPIEFYVRGVNGLPKGWHVSHIVPSFKEPQLLHPLSKHHPVYFELETENEVAAGLRFSIDLEIGMVGFPEDEFHTQFITHQLVKRTTPYEIENPNSDLNVFMQTYRPAKTERLGLVEITHIERAFHRPRKDVQ